jgi:hypothetical protein
MLPGKGEMQQIDLPAYREKVYKQFDKNLPDKDSPDYRYKVQFTNNFLKEFEDVCLLIAEMRKMPDLVENAYVARFKRDNLKLKGGFPGIPKKMYHPPDYKPKAKGEVDKPIYMITTDNQNTMNKKTLVADRLRKPPKKGKLVPKRVKVRIKGWKPKSAAEKAAEEERKKEERKKKRLEERKKRLEERKKKAEEKKRKAEEKKKKAEELKKKFQLKMPGRVLIDPSEYPKTSAEAKPDYDRWKRKGQGPDPAEDADQPVEMMDIKENNQQRAPLGPPRPEFEPTNANEPRKILSYQSKRKSRLKKKRNYFKKYHSKKKSHSKKKRFTRKHQRKLDDLKSQISSQWNDAFGVFGNPQSQPNQQPPLQNQFQDGTQNRTPIEQGSLQYSNMAFSNNPNAQQSQPGTPYYQMANNMANPNQSPYPISFNQPQQPGMAQAPSISLGPGRLLESVHDHHSSDNEIHEKYKVTKFALKALKNLKERYGVQYSTHMDSIHDKLKYFSGYVTSGDPITKLEILKKKLSKAMNLIKKKRNHKKIIKIKKKNKKKNENENKIMENHPKITISDEEKEKIRQLILDGEEEDPSKYDNMTPEQILEADKKKAAATAGKNIYII